MFRKRLVLIANIAVPLGFIWGGLLTSHIVSRTGYFRHHLYNTCARMLAAEVNQRTFCLAATLLALWALYGIVFKLKGFVRGLAILAVLGTLAIVVRRSELIANASDYLEANSSWLHLALLKDMFTDGILQILACLSLVVAGVFILRRMNNGSRNRIHTVQSAQVGKESFFASLYRQSLSNSTTILESTKLTFAIILPLLLLVNLLPYAFQAKNAVTLKKKPNVIFIMVDTLRADHLHCYGYPRNTSPNIDALANDGMRFQKAISQAPWTSASVSSFMSSRYLRISYKVGPQGMPDDVLLLPEVLRDNGYVTAASISNPLAGRMAGLDRGYELYYQADDNVKEYSKRSDGVLTNAFSQLDKIKDQKFFMFVLFMDPHGPYMWREKHQFYPEYKGKLGKKPALAEANITPDDSKYIVSLYDSGIASADDYVGEVIRYLKKNKLYEDTLIVFLSDHGEELHEHNIWGHGLHLYDECISVPLIVKVPGQTSGRVIKGSFPLINLFPSVMDTIQYDVTPYGLQGKSAHFAGLRQTRETNIYSSTHFKYANLTSLRSSKKKLIKDQEYPGTLQFFDLSTDPLEQHKLLSNSRASDLIAQRKLLEQQDSYIDASLASSVSTPHQMSSKDTSTLRALGYLQ